MYKDPYTRYRMRQISFVHAELDHEVMSPEKVLYAPLYVKATPQVGWLVAGAAGLESSGVECLRESSCMLLPGA